MDPGAFAGKRRSVTLLVRTANGRDSYGNAIYAQTEVPVTDCLIAPYKRGREEHDNADRTRDVATLYVLSGNWPDDSTNNRVRLDDGTVWEINGNPERWPGAIGGVVVDLERVSG